MKRLLYLIFLLCIQQLNAQSLTESDRISINKRTYSLLTAPLDQYFMENPALSPNSPAPSTLKERLYRAHWNIENRQLMLTQIEGMRDGSPLPLGHRLPLAAGWFSGLLVIPTGQELYFDLNGEAVSFSRYQLYIVENGRIIEGKSMTYAEYEVYKKLQFQQFKQTKEYQDMKQSLAEYGLEGNLDEFIFSENIGFLDISIPFS